jgi:ABC-type cobalamin/Fe3+-siderophores transport system ATPase subunit
MEAITTKGLNLFYGDFHAIKVVSISVLPRRITALIGPSGCGKSTLLRTFNRMNDLIPGVRITGDAMIFGRPLGGEDVHALRKWVGVDDLAGKVDFVLAFAVVRELPGTEAFLAEAYRSLKAGGRMLVAEPKHHVSETEMAKTMALARSGARSRRC